MREVLCDHCGRNCAVDTTTYFEVLEATFCQSCAFVHQQGGKARLSAGKKMASGAGTPEGRKKANPTELPNTVRTAFGQVNPWQGELCHLSYTLFQVYVSRDEVRRLHLLEFCRLKVLGLRDVFAQAGNEPWEEEMLSLHSALCRIPAYADDDARETLRYLIRQILTLAEHVADWDSPLGVGCPLPARPLPEARPLREAAIAAREAEQGRVPLPQRLVKEAHHGD